MKSDNHYELAFEDYLRHRQAPFIAVNEAQRSIVRDVRLKSFDFIVYSGGQRHWLVDVKGRRFARTRAKRAPTWQNWVTRSDLDDLAAWQAIFGANYGGLLVFAYWVDDDSAAAELVHVFRDQRYIFAGVPVDDYRVHAKLRSPKWETVNVPRAAFAEVVRPMAEWL